MNTIEVELDEAVNRLKADRERHTQAGLVVGRQWARHPDTRERMLRGLARAQAPTARVDDGPSVR